MAYQKRNFVKEQLLTAEDMNAMDEQIAKNEEATNDSVLRKRYLTASDHLDNITEQGVYTWLNGDPPEGRPLEPETGDQTPRSALMVVYNFNDQYVQIVYEHITMRTAKRTKFSYEETWSDWALSLEIVQYTGDSDYYVMSQAAVTAQLDLIKESIEGLGGSGDTGDSSNDYSNVILALSMVYTSGVFLHDDADAIKPNAAGGLSVVNNPGTIMIEGHAKKYAKITSTYIVSDEDRTEVFLCRLDKNTGEIERLFRDVIVYDDMLISREDATELPVREGNIYDILIHKVTIPANATEITADMIEDLRTNEAYCGSVRNKLGTV